jgi:hypothetical protein
MFAEVGVGVFLAEWLGIGDPLPVIPSKLANVIAAERLTLDATRCQDAPLVQLSGDCAADRTPHDWPY